MVACGNDKNNSFNQIEGEWIIDKDSSSVTMIFTDDTIVQRFSPNEEEFMFRYEWVGSTTIKYYNEMRQGSKIHVLNSEVFYLKKLTQDSLVFTLPDEGLIFRFKKVDN